MNDRYLFKANRVDNGEWVQGNLITDEQDEKKCFIAYIFGTDDEGQPHDIDFTLVDPSTICQCTGLKDKNGNLIWENDVVKDEHGNLYKAFWQSNYYQFSLVCVKSEIFQIGTKWDLYVMRSFEIEVIGNIFDNPELLETLELGEEKTKERKIPLGLKVGDKFDLAGTNWTILDIKEDGYLCLADSIGDSAFDSESNNWTTSKLREHLNTEFAEKISDEIGEENIVQFNRDLMSLDGQTEYGTCLDSVSLLTVDEYRKYRQFIPNYGDWWWLASPWSTPCNNDETWAAVVSPSGNFGSNDYDCGSGVRPVCIFASAIFESEE